MCCVGLGLCLGSVFPSFFCLFFVSYKRRQDGAVSWVRVRVKGQGFGIGLMIMVEGEGGGGEG